MKAARRLPGWTVGGYQHPAGKLRSQRAGGAGRGCWLGREPSFHARVRQSVASFAPPNRLTCNALPAAATALCPSAVFSFGVLLW